MMRIRPKRAPTIPIRQCVNVRRVPWAGGHQRWNSEKTRPAPPNLSLQEQLQKAIEATGPISVAKYMRQCLTAMELGYYSRSSVEDEQIGTKGDFITSPEISQMFGELVGIWIVSEWMAQGQKTSGLHLIEFGPGKGTLMDDILRTLRNFPALFKSLEGITLVESSENLRLMQSKLLCPADSKPVYDENIAGYRSVSKYSADLPVTWTSEPRYIPNDKEMSPFIIAHEFFDALPIHVFQTVDSKSSGAQGSGPSEVNGQPLKRSQGSRNRWRELLVDNQAPSSSLTSSSTSTSPPKPESDMFRLGLSNIDTPHSLLLPLESARYASVLDLPAGSTIEISPESLSLARQISILVGGSSTTPLMPPNSRSTRPSSLPPSQPEPRNGPPSGAALIIDYGPSTTIPTGTLRGIRSHKLVSPFSSPGSVDLSADVDFGGLVHAALEASEDVEVHGPVPQGYFLRALGGEERLKMMLEKLGDGKETEELKERLKKAWVRLVDQGPRGMGGLYKAMAVLPCIKGREGRRPVGFGGGVVEGQNT